MVQQCWSVRLPYFSALSAFLARGLRAGFTSSAFSALGFRPRFAGAFSSAGAASVLGLRPRFAGAFSSAAGAALGLRVRLAANRIAVTINKQNYSHHVIKQTGVMNVCCLDTSAPFSVFQTFGFQSGRTADKFAGIEELRSDNGLRFLPRYINSFMSLKVESYVDLDTHGMFICSVTEARVISDRETMTYTYYQNNVKPKPETEGKHGFVCKVCGWIYEGDTLPDDIVCPLCKHGAADFEPIG